jgi:NADH-quinone oxidoreductase subunit F/NADP-reducing hydrogenase subunit HndC
MIPAWSTWLFTFKFAREESFGQCAPCRIGTQQMVAILEKITVARVKLSDLDLLEKIGLDHASRPLFAAGADSSESGPVCSPLFPA